MMQTDDRSLKGLVADLGGNIATLFRKEIQLARAETAEKIGQAGTAVASIAAGGIVALIAYVLVHKGLRDLKASSLAPNRTVDALKRDADVVKEQLP